MNWEKYVYSPENNLIPSHPLKSFSLPLYRAQAFLMRNDVESCIGAGRELFHNIEDTEKAESLNFFPVF
jgi:hypothetical protein